MGRVAHGAFPATGVCLGNTDMLKTRYLGGQGASHIVGWAWDLAAKAPVGHVILTDAKDVIVGGGESGLLRPDVPKARPMVTSSVAGWAATTPNTSGRVGAYGVIDGGRALCALGGLDL